MSYSCIDAIATLLTTGVRKKLVRRRDFDGDDPATQASLLDSCLDRYAGALNTIHELVANPKALQAIPEPIKTALKEILLAHAGGPFMSCESYGHCFVGSKESTTRWVIDLRKEDNPILFAQVKIGARWHRLDDEECKDLLADLQTNEVRVRPDDYGAQWSCRLPEWLPNDVHKELVDAGAYEHDWTPQ
ncbi:MAG: hypothetical protein O9327_01980 [Polaromonas sp.]|nr:hypothetical protein [Polaromonas sp.]